MTSPVRLAVRALVTWMIEAAGLYLMLRYLPDVHVARWETAIVAVLVIGLLNALVRPVVLILAANLGIVPFLIVALLLNGLLVQVAAWIVPGFDLVGIFTPYLVALGLAAINTIFTTLFSIHDDDSFYRNVIRRLARRMVSEGDLEGPGTVIVQIDGLAEPILRRALAEGRMPTLAKWLEAGSHQLTHWECGVPSMTTSSQAGILHGNGGEVPAFYWYQKPEKRLMSSASPRDLHAVQRLVSNGRGLLSENGVSVTNLFGGDAERSVMTVGTLLDDDGALKADPADFYGYLLNPYNLYRGIVGMIGESFVESWQALRQWAQNVTPRVRRFGLFTIQRGAATVVLRDATTWTVVASMYQGRRAIYCDYLGYDEVAHFAGPETRDSVATLFNIDRQIRQIALAAREAPRPYQIAILSDHGQTTAPIFQTVYGKGLDAVVRDVIAAGPTLQFRGGRGEPGGYLSAFLSQLSGAEGMPGRGARRLLRTKRGSGLLDPVAEQLQRASADDVEIVVTSSGSLAHIYFAKVPERLTLEQISAAYPALIPTLLEHDGIGLVLVRSEERGAIVMSKHGIRELEPDRDCVAEGDDPLAGFGEHTARFLCQLAGFQHTGDIVVNGTWDPSTNWVIGFDDLVGAHGGLGGPQTRPFLIYPSEWAEQPPKLVGPAQMHQFLRRHTTDDGETGAETVDEVRESAERVAELAIEAEQAPDVTAPNDDGPAERSEQTAAVRDGG
jgi:uncharacterized membrane protein YvlD (DUF360 family)